MTRFNLFGEEAMSACGFCVEEVRFCALVSNPRLGLADFDYGI